MQYSIAEQQKYWSRIPRKSSAIGVLLFNESEEILIVKPHYKDHWTIPGGVIDEHESPFQAMVREAKEEIGLDIAIERLLVVLYLQRDIGEKIFDCYQFFVMGRVKGQSATDTDGEIEDSKWVSPAAAKEFLNQRGIRILDTCLKAQRQQTVIYDEVFVE